MNEELTVLLQGRPAGRLRRRSAGRVDFVYDPGWRGTPGAFPVSLSMPLAASEHGSEVAEPYFWNLLPDNETLLERWGRNFGVSARNVFGILSHVGEDLAGAIQVVSPERLDVLLSDGPEEVQWLTETEVAERLRAVLDDVSATRLPRDSGQFSLAGTQPKTTLLERDGRWGVPRGRTPTTHIFKPPAGEWPAVDRNEHFCLSLARTLGLPVAQSSVRRFKDELTIVIERYDRMLAGSRLVRIHQEDFCQALSVRPALKYQNEGGPGIKDIVRTLRTYSTSPDEDVATFLDALALNWLIGGTDAHAKNFSLLIGAGGKVRLAPLYDIVSRMAYDPWHPFELKLAMRIGGEYTLGRINAWRWGRLAAEIDLTPEDLWGRVLRVARELPSALDATSRETKAHGLADPVIDRLVERATAWAKQAAAGLEAALRGEAGSAAEEE